MKKVEKAKKGIHLELKIVSVLRILSAHNKNMFRNPIVGILPELTSRLSERLNNI